MAITKTKIKTEVYRMIDETSGSSYFSDADVIAFVNREAEFIGTNYPVRIANFPITGDGSTLDFKLPEPLHKVIALEEGNTFTPPRTFVDVIGAGGLRTTLTRDLFSSYGFSFRPPDRIRVESTLGSGESRTLWAYCSCGTLNGTTITASSVTVTQNSKTLSASTTVNTASAEHLNTVYITDSNGDTETRILDSVASTGNTLVLTEPYAGDTDGSASIEIGNHLYLTEDYLELLLYGAVLRLNRKEQNWESAMYYSREYNIEKRRKRANLQRIAKLGSERFHSF